jgi:hypothetical protein
MKLKPKVAAPPVESLADEWDDGGAANAWGTDDLIDVNADTDDWAAFESAPVPEIVVPPPQSYYLKPTTNGSAKPAACQSSRTARQNYTYTFSQTHFKTHHASCASVGWMGR